MTYRFRSNSIKKESDKQFFERSYIIDQRVLTQKKRKRKSENDQESPKEKKSRKLKLRV